MCIRGKKWAGPISISWVPVWHTRMISASHQQSLILWRFMLWEGEVDKNCDFPFLNWYSYKETCDFFFLPRNIDHLLRSLLKKKTKNKNCILLEMHLWWYVQSLKSEFIFYYSFNSTEKSHYCSVYFLQTSNQPELWYWRNIF